MGGGRALRDRAGMLLQQSIPTRAGSELLRFGAHVVRSVPTAPRFLTQGSAFIAVASVKARAGRGGWRYRGVSSAR
jgi:hypothetical protein